MPLKLSCLAAALTVAGCASSSEPVARVPDASLPWQTLHAEQWDINPAAVVVPVMPARKS